MEDVENRGQEDRREEGGRDITSVPASLADYMIALNNEHCPQSE